MIRSLIVALILSSIVMYDACAIEYKGKSVDDYNQFIEKYNLDWPSPITIDYFEPTEGKGSIRYAHWVPKSKPIIGTVVHFNGRTEFIERNIYTYKDLLDMGYEAYAPT